MILFLAVAHGHAVQHRAIGAFLGRPVTVTLQARVSCAGKEEDRDHVGVRQREGGGGRYRRVETRGSVHGCPVGAVRGGEKRGGAGGEVRRCVDRGAGGEIATLRLPVVHVADPEIQLPPFCRGG